MTQAPQLQHEVKPTIVQMTSMLVADDIAHSVAYRFAMQKMQLHHADESVFRHRKHGAAAQTPQLQQTHNSCCMQMAHTSSLLDLGKGLAKVLHPLHAGCTRLVLVLQIPFLLHHHRPQIAQKVDCSLEVGVIL